MCKYKNQEKNKDINLKMIMMINYQVLIHKMIFLMVQLKKQNKVVKYLKNFNKNIQNTNLEKNKIQSNKNPNLIYDLY